MNRKKITPLPPHKGGNPFHEELPIWGAGVENKTEIHIEKRKMEYYDKDYFNFRF